MRKYVFDACSLIAYTNDEQGADVVEQLIGDAGDGTVKLFMNRINLTEVYYDAWKSRGEQAAEEFIQGFSDLPVTVIDVLSESVMKVAARFKTSYKVSVADSFALATALLEDAALVTSDHHEFDVIEKAEEVSFHWIR
jgi:predicted nucleic acid-binding protein